MHICRNGCLNQIFLILFDFPFPSGLGAYAPDYLQICVVDSGNTDLIVSVNPLRLSVTVMSISSTPLALRSVSTLIQQEELSLLPIHIPKTSLQPLLFNPTHKYTVLLMILPASLTLRRYHPSKRPYRVSLTSDSATPMLPG